MKELELKYGCNPNQKPARVFMENGAALPMEILNGRPGYINPVSYTHLDVYKRQLVLKSEASVEIGGGVSGVVIEIQPFQRQIAETVLHHRAHGFSSQALPAQGRIGDINPPKLTLPAALDVGQYDAADFLQ